MSCKHIEDRLADYINFTLNKEEQVRVESHLEHCESCREELEFLKSYYRGVESLAEVGAPINLLDNIHAELEKPQGFKESFNLFLQRIDRIKLPLEIAGIAAAAALFLFVISPFREMEMGGKKSTYVAMESFEESLPEVEEAFEEIALDKETAAPPVELEKQTETVREQGEEPLQEMDRLNRVDDSQGEMEEIRLNEEKTDLAEGDGSYEVALVLRTFSNEATLYQAEQDYTVQKSKRSFATKDMARSSSDSATLLEEEGITVELRSILANFSEATIEFSYQADGVTPQQAIIKVKTADYSALLEQLANLGLVEGPQVDPVTVSTTHMRVVLRFEE